MTDTRSMPSGRVQRAAKVGGLVGGEVARSYATKAANLVRSQENRGAATQRRRQDGTARVVEVLGQMKGPAMKLGQMASVWGFAGLPAAGGEQRQATLGVLRGERGEDVTEVFAECDVEPVAAASLGQVSRARLHDGRAVAVKVQYPGAAAAVRADLQNLRLILRAARRFAPGLDPAATAVELRERIGEELDYEHEAQAQRIFARRWRGHPFILVPDVGTSLCRGRVLVTVWIDGIGFDQIKEASRATRDRVGEIVLRFFLGSLYRFGHF